MHLSFSLEFWAPPRWAWSHCYNTLLCFIQKHINFERKLNLVHWRFIDWIHWIWWKSGFLHHRCRNIIITKTFHSLNSEYHSHGRLKVNQPEKKPQNPKKLKKEKVHSLCVCVPVASDSNSNVRVTKLMNGLVSRQLLRVSLCAASWYNIKWRKDRVGPTWVTEHYENRVHDLTCPVAFGVNTQWKHKERRS